MANPDNPLQTGFYFSLKISSDSGDGDAAFQDVSGLTKEVGIEDVVSGGENRFKYRLPTVVSYQNLVLKRGIVLEASPLIGWCMAVMDQGYANAIQTKDVILRLLNPEGQVAMQWEFVNAWPIKWAISDLKSQDNAMLIETIELAHQYFTVTGRESSLASSSPGGGG